MILKLKKILKDNNISNVEIERYLNIYRGYLTDKLSLRRDFTINELKLIKVYLVNKGIINDDYDYADFLDLVEDD
mgnify:CR=1 FL=1